MSPAYVCTLQIEQTVVRSLFRRMHVRNGSLARAPHEPPDSGTRRTHSTPSRKVHRCQVLLGLARRRTVSFPTACVGRGDHALGRVDAFGCSANASIVFFLESGNFSFSVRRQGARDIRRGQQRVATERRLVCGPTSLVGLETINVTHGTANRATLDAAAVGVTVIIVSLVPVGGGAPLIPRRSVTH